jgi:hypothetical protein
MKRILLELSSILILIILVLVFGYIIFARFEGKNLNINQLPSEDTLSRQSQGLMVGSYIVFVTFERQPVNTQSMKIWRVQFGKTNPEILYEHQAIASNVKPQISRFSDESLRVNFITSDGEIVNQLIHLNGQVIGPAENGLAIISPDREWILVSPDTERSKIFLKNIIRNESFDITPTSTKAEIIFNPLRWSMNGTKVYFSNNLGMVYEFNPQAMQLNTIITSSSNNFLPVFFPDNDIVWGVNSSKQGESIFVKYFDEELKNLVFFADKKIQSAALSPYMDKIAFTLEDNNIWLKDISNQQIDMQTLVGNGSALIWPNRNNIIYKTTTGLFNYNIITATSTQLFTTTQITNLVTWDFLDMLYIQ